MKKPIAVILSLSVFAVVYAQRPRTQKRVPPKTAEQKPPPKVSIQTATTKDGRTVLLKSDGTWEYSADPIPQPSPVTTPEELSLTPTPSPTPPPVSVSLTGKWAIKFTGNNGQSFPATMDISKNGEEWAATLDFGPKQMTSRLVVNGDKFEVAFREDAQNALGLSGTLEGSTIQGTMILSGPQGGTGSFVGHPMTAGSSTSIGTGNLVVQAGIVYRMGGPQPVARTQFYLLKRDLADILIEAGLRPDRNMNIVQTFAFAARYQSLANYARFYQIASVAIQSHVVATVTTDFAGMAQFVSIPAGTYYLMGYTQTRGGFALWNLPIGISTGQNAIVLDQNNAAIAL